MSSITILFIALSLAADAFAVSVVAGISEKKIHIQNALKMAWIFGFFQAIMPVIGFTFASFFSSSIEHYDHWIAFILLSYIGANMSYEWWKWWGEEKIIENRFGYKSLIMLGIATSIDALAVGISLTATTDSIVIPAIIIGIVTFLLSFLGIEFWKKWWEKIGKYAEIIGGFILVTIGIKILIEHIFF